MQDIILARIEASRKELLDLGMRNPLLNYKANIARGLHIVQEKSTSIYEILVKQNKAMSFLGRPGKEETSELFEELPVLSEEALQEAYNDTRLQTNETELKLQTKLLNTYYFACTSIEEQGVNILYLSLGMLEWYEASNTENVRHAPLLLIPVTLERSSAHERFRLKFNGSDIGANLSLQAKMLAEFQLTIPDLPDADDFNVEEYFKDIQERVQHQLNWKVDVDAIELGFFSFGKFMIYHDLDSSRWPEQNKPYDHPILRSLFGTGFNEVQPTATEEHNLDSQTNADDLFHVVDADSSQVLAMLAVNEGRNMVIQGPPGTGKSQTITNIIANAVGQGKKVLFVAEKMAALEVVKRRLDSINLGEACLELHSHKANKKDLHEELKRILELGKPTLTQLQQEVALLADYKKELNEYCTAVNAEIGQSGLSAQKVMGYLLQVAGQTGSAKLPKILLKDMESWNKEKMNRAEAMADRIQARLQEIGTPSKLPYWGSGLTVLLPHEEEKLREQLETVKEATYNFKQQAESLASYLGLPFPVSNAETSKLTSFAKLASEAPDLKGLNITDDAWLLNKQDIEELLNSGRKLGALHQQYKDIFLTDAWEQNLLEVRQHILAYGDKWYKFIKGDYKKSNQQLAALLKTGLPEDNETKLKYIDDIGEARRLETILKEFEEIALKLFASNWQKLRSDWNKFEKAALYLREIHQQIVNQSCPKVLLVFLERNENVAEIKAKAEMLLKHRATMEAKQSELAEKLKLNESSMFNGALFKDQSFDDQLLLLRTWLKYFATIHQVIGWNNLSETAKEEEFNPLLDLSLHWDGAKDLLKLSIQKLWYENLIEQAVTASPALRKFERTSHEEVVTKFKQLDLLNQQYNRARVALRHWEAVPRHEAGGQVNILKGEFNRRARHMPIRKLVQEAGLAIQAIKPVIMMSPMSIANFLAPGSIEFDLVIFDEASQVRPVDAIGALLRGKQLVVVGDTKQMPPTSFFDKLNTDVEDEENVTADVQSILGMCNGQGAPERMLRWHYRSRHESLISLSNKEFYENKLVIFPSPGSKYRMGLAFHHLPDSIYDRGKTRSNPKEAEAVADAVIEHAQKYPKQSLGVIAFSTAQMQAIQFAIENRRRRYPEVESFFRSHASEPFFVKNLENVQGDERDVIFISIGYGRTEDGKVPMSFGPLNNEGGERRLNVLITRAKHRCEVFTNITSEDIKPTPATKFGIRTLKSFLYFAQHGKFEMEETRPIPDKRPFEDQVALQLEKCGYTIRKKVGSEGFYIDLAVVDPENPGRYLLGIDCDGEAYAQARSARDRDRLRKQVLMSMEWRMYHVWSTDWLRNPNRELERLVAAIEKAKEQTALDDIVAEEILLEQTALVREEVVPLTTSLPVYELAALPPEVAQTELHLQSFGKIGEWIEAVVKVESPIHFEEMARRLVDGAGVSKIGARIRYTINSAADYAERSGLIKKRGDFLWHPEMEVPLIRDRSRLPSSSRKLQLISPEELSLAIKKVVEKSIAIQPNAVVPFVAKMFGFARVTEEMKKEILSVIEHDIANNTLQQNGELLKVNA